LNIFPPTAVKEPSLKSQLVCRQAEILRSCTVIWLTLKLVKLLTAEVQKEHAELLSEKNYSSLDSIIKYI
jgi:hypothetical protein